LTLPDGSLPVSLRFFERRPQPLAKPRTTTDVHSKQDNAASQYQFFAILTILTLLTIFMFFMTLPKLPIPERFIVFHWFRVVGHDAKLFVEYDAID